MANLSIQGNLLVIYTRKAQDLSQAADESALPDAFRKYLEYGTASRALRANTDGQLLSLADFWEVRRKAAYEVMARFRYQRLADRVLQFATRVGGCCGGLRPRHPRLPSNFNDPYV